MFKCEKSVTSQTPGIVKLLGVIGNCGVIETPRSQFFTVNSSEVEYCFKLLCKDTHEIETLYDNNLANEAMVQTVSFR